MSDINNVRAILQRGPALKTWWALIDALQGWQASEEALQVAIDESVRQLRDWPEQMPLFAPTDWFRREPAQIEADPLTRLFVFAFQERTRHFRRWAERFIERRSVRNPPKFLDFSILKMMHWRSGEALQASQLKQLISLLRKESLHTHSADLERVRQLLDDRDCQRWSAAIHDAWEDDGAKARHEWAVLQVAYLGREVRKT